MSSKPKPVTLPFERKTTNEYGWQSQDPNNQFVKDYMDTPTGVDPGAGRRTDLREQEEEGSWNSAFTSGLPLHVRMQMQASNKRKLQSQGAAEAQQAEYERNLLELKKRERLLPQQILAGSHETGYNSQLPQNNGGGWLGSTIGAAGNVLGSLIRVGALSDQDMKENIKPVDGVLDRLDDYQAREWDWKDGSGHDVGVVAQEMNEAFPEAVVPGDGKRPWMVKPATENAILLQGLKELNEKVDRKLTGKGKR